MVMQICPNCLISVSYQKNICHQCGNVIDKLPQSSQDILPRIRSSKAILFQKFKLRRSNKLKMVDWIVKARSRSCKQYSKFMWINPFDIVSIGYINPARNGGVVIWFLFLLEIFNYLSWNCNYLKGMARKILSDGVYYETCI